MVGALTFAQLEQRQLLSKFARLVMELINTALCQEQQAASMSAIARQASMYQW
jgi:hypothetical protein